MAQRGACGPCLSWSFQSYRAVMNCGCSNLEKVFHNGPVLFFRLNPKFCFICATRFHQCVVVVKEKKSPGTYKQQCGDAK